MTAIADFLSKNAIKTDKNHSKSVKNLSFETAHGSGTIIFHTIWLKKKPNSLKNPQKSPIFLAK
jgi:hypothetical protein